MIGCGYVGLVTGTCLAELGHHVVCTDNDPERIASLKSGVVPIYEPYLDAMLAANCQAKRLSFTSDAGEAVRAGEVIFICVGTPPLESGDADLSAIDNVARLIAAEAHESKLVVEKSTVPAQTGQQLKRVLPSIIVRGYADASRAIIKTHEQTSENCILVEGYGLAACMATEGVIGTATTTSRHNRHSCKNHQLRSCRSTI